MERMMHIGHWRHEINMVWRRCSRHQVFACSCNIHTNTDSYFMFSKLLLLNTSMYCSSSVLLFIYDNKVALIILKYRLWWQYSVLFHPYQDTTKIQIYTSRGGAISLLFSFFVFHCINIHEERKTKIIKR